jgi:hypothetical protein
MKESLQWGFGPGEHPYTPVVLDGPFAGPVDVDDIVPVRDAPEQDCAWALAWKGGLEKGLANL